MFKEKFEMILDKDEEIKWCEGVNSSAYIMKKFPMCFLFGLIPPLAVIGLGASYGWLTLLLAILKVIPMLIGVGHFVISIIVCFIVIAILNKDAKNTFLCITNKRVIKRWGAFNNKFIHYSLKNIGTVMANGNIFDSTGKNASATLKIVVKDYHTNTDANTIQNSLLICSLNNAYEAYKILSGLTEGNNENLRVEIQK